MAAMGVSVRSLGAETVFPETDLSATRQNNRKLLKRTLVICLSIDAVLALLIVYMMVLHTPYFNLQKVEVTGNRRLSRDEIVEASEIHDRVNLLTVDLNAIADKLRRHPWIRSASVYRRFPGQMIIEVDERSPRGVLAAGKLYYLDDQGEICTRVLPGESVDFPLFTGLNPDDLKQSAAEVQDLVRAGFNLMDLLERTGSEIDPSGIAETRLNLDEGLALQTRSGRVVTFGRGDFELKLNRYGRLKRFLTQTGEWNNAKIINLDFEDRALVRSDKSRLQG
jgi:cell division protein FtsQ